MVGKLPDNDITRWLGSALKRLPLQCWIVTKTRSKQLSNGSGGFSMRNRKSSSTVDPLMSHSSCAITQVLPPYLMPLDESEHRNSDVAWTDLSIALVYFNSCYDRYLYSGLLRFPSTNLTRKVGHAIGEARILQIDLLPDNDIWFAGWLGSFGRVILVSGAVFGYGDSYIRRTWEST